LPKANFSGLRRFVRVILPLANSPLDFDPDDCEIVVPYSASLSLVVKEPAQPDVIFPTQKVRVKVAVLETL
jgi:hypothetical protein